MNFNLDSYVGFRLLKYRYSRYDRWSQKCNPYSWKMVCDGDVELIEDYKKFLRK